MGNSEQQIDEALRAWKKRGFVSENREQTQEELKLIVQARIADNLERVADKLESNLKIFERVTDSYNGYIKIKEE